MTTETTLDALFAGRVQDLWPGKAPSAIDKRPIRSARIGATGLVDDEQADLRAHGGPGKAIHIYPAQHYTSWRADLGHNDRFTAGGFGENISLKGFGETDTCIGDVWQVGTAILQVSQGRQPCWKLAAHVGIKTMVDLVRNTRRTGWYMRVLQDGEIGVGDTIARTDRPNPGVTVDRVSRAIFDKSTPADELADLACVPELDDAWTAILGRRAAKVA